MSPDGGHVCRIHPSSSFLPTGAWTQRALFPSASIWVQAMVSNHSTAKKGVLVCIPPGSLAVAPSQAGCIPQRSGFFFRITQGKLLVVSLHLSLTLANSLFIRLYSNYPLGIYHLIPARTLTDSVLHRIVLLKVNWKVIGMLLLLSKFRNFWIERRGLAH